MLSQWLACVHEEGEVEEEEENSEEGGTIIIEGASGRA